MKDLKSDPVTRKYVESTKTEGAAYGGLQASSHPGSEQSPAPQPAFSRDINKMRKAAGLKKGKEIAGHLPWKTAAKAAGAVDFDTEGSGTPSVGKVYAYDEEEREVGVFDKAANKGTIKEASTDWSREDKQKYYAGYEVGKADKKRGNDATLKAIDTGLGTNPSWREGFMDGWNGKAPKVKSPMEFLGEWVDNFAKDLKSKT